MTRRLSNMETVEARLAAKKAADGLRAFARAHQGGVPTLEDVEKLMMALSAAKFDLSLLGMQPMERIEARNRRAADTLKREHRTDAALKRAQPTVRPPPKLPRLKIPASPPEQDLWFHKM